MEFHRGRDRYFRKHGIARHPAAVDGMLDLGVPRPRGRGARAARRATRGATCCTRASSCGPAAGRGLREAAEAYNRLRDAAAAGATAH